MNCGAGWAAPGWRDYYLERAGGLNVDTMVTGSEMIAQVDTVAAAPGWRDYYLERQAGIKIASDQTHEMAV